MSAGDPSHQSDPGLAVCLASSFLGHYTHAGFLTGLERHGIRPGRIAGASAGAIAGGLWASGLRGEEYERAVFDKKLRRAFLDWGAVWRGFGVALWAWSSGILNGGRVKQHLDALMGELRIEDCQSPRIEIAVANVTRRRGEIRTSGRLSDFIVASFSVPLVFTTQRIEGEEFLDGGVFNETPFDHWLDDPNIHTILVHRVRHHVREKQRRRWTAGTIFGVCHSIAGNELFERRKRAAEASGKRVIFLETWHRHPGLFPGSLVRQNFEEGVRTAAGVASTLTGGREVGATAAAS